MIHHYDQVVDGIIFRGEYTIENDDEGYIPIFTVNSIFINSNMPDLLLVIDPRVVHEIEAALLADHQWNA